MKRQEKIRNAKPGMTKTGNVEKQREALNKCQISLTST
jgi:hypothetical protein